MSSLTLAPGEMLVIVVPDTANMKQEIFDDLIDGTIEVNTRFARRGKPPLLALVLA